MHWLHSELQTIYCTDLSLSALLTCLSCLSLSLSALCSSSAFCLASSCSLSSCFHSKLLKIQVTLLNNISRKSFGSSHQIAHYGLRNHIPQPHPGVDPGFGQGGAQLLRPKVANIAKRSRASKVSILRLGSRAR